MRIAKEISKLNLPIGSFVVFGSCVLEMRKIRQARDIDIVVTPEVFNKLKADNSWRHVKHDNYETLEKGIFDITTSWDHPGGLPNVNELLESAEFIDGIPCVTLERVENWKRSKMREKDLRDLELIKRYKTKNKQHVKA